MPLIEVKELEVSYGDTDVLFGVNLQVNQGEVVAIVGSNGAGKTTLMQAIACLIPSRSGSIKLHNQDISRLPTHQAVERGLVYVPEGRRLFPRLSVRSNLELGAFTPRAREHAKATLDTIYQLFPILKSRENQLAGTMSGGEQQMCAIGRGLMSRPEVLMIDEVSLGLAPVIVNRVYDAIREIRSLGMSLVVVEQNVKLAFGISDRAYVIKHGKVALQGPSQDLINDPDVKKAYLGT